MMILHIFSCTFGSFVCPFCKVIILIFFPLSWIFGLCIIAVVQLLSCVQLFATLWISGFPVLHYLPELAQTHVHWVNDAIEVSCPLPSASPPAFYLLQHQGLCQWAGSSHQVVKVSELQLQHQSFQSYSGLISFRIDWVDLLAVQGTLKSLQHDNSKTSVLRRSVFFMVQLSHSYVTTSETIALTIWAFVDRVMSPLFNMLSRFVLWGLLNILYV